MERPTMNKSTRRNFLKTTLVTSAVLSAPAIVTARRTDPHQDEVVTGSGEYQYKVNHRFAQLPEKYNWQTTHNVAVDSANNLYVIHEGRASLKDHPSIFVFGPDGKFIRAFGCQYQGGGHGIEVRKEGNEEFLYVAAYQQVKCFAKMTLTGETVWYKKAPMESGVYDEGEDTSTKSNWTRKGFLPTNFAFLDDGGFLLADGYGSHCIHQFDKNAKWVKVFGGTGEGKGKFNLCHGLWIDNRKGRKPSIIVTDRSHNTLQYLTMDGRYIETMTDYGLPANIDIRGNIMMIPELKARVTLLNEKNEVVARLGAAVERVNSIKDLRKKPDQWIDGQFVHPHDACFDNEGNIFVAEWVHTGRVTKLTRV
jgi:hypothetical protein